MAKVTVRELIELLQEEDQDAEVQLSVAEGLAPLHSVETFSDCLILWDGNDWRTWA